MKEYAPEAHDFGTSAMEGVVAFVVLPRRPLAEGIIFIVVCYIDFFFLRSQMSQALGYTEDDTGDKKETFLGNLSACFLEMWKHNGAICTGGEAGLAVIAQRWFDKYWIPGVND